MPLDRAWLEFASAEDRRRYCELPTLAQLAGDVEALKAGLANLVTHAVQQWVERGKFESELRELLLVELFNDQLWAYGYRIAPSASRAPVRIAAELFDNHDPDWKRECLDARGFRYAEIRIVDPSDIGNVARPRTGRKGSADAIRNAITRLIQEGADICGMDRKSLRSNCFRIGRKCAKGLRIKRSESFKVYFGSVPKARN